MKKILIIVIFASFFYGCINDQQNEVENILIGMYQWESRTNGLVKFILVPIGQEEISIFKSSIKKYDGLTLTNKWIMLSDTSVRTVVHETGHVLGLQHEHQRPDRDLFIKIDYDKLLDKYGLAGLYSFLYIIPELYDYQKYNYDYSSVMHYNSKNVGDVIDSNGIPLSGDTPSEIDIQKIKDIYADNPRVITYALYGFNL
jgi:hypothetical protein